MNRQERRQAGKGQSDERIQVTGLIVYFANGQHAQLDINKVQVVDKETGRPLFDEVLDATPRKLDPEKGFEDPAPKSQSFTGGPDRIQGVPKDILKRAKEAGDEHFEEAFDTVNGRFVYVQEGNWSGIRPARNDE